MFSLVEHRRGPKWLPSLGQWFAIAHILALMWLLGFLPYVQLTFWIEAVVYVGVGWCASAYLLIMGSGEFPIRTLMARTSLTGLWVGPAVVLSLAPSPYFAIAGFLLMGGVANVFARETARRAAGIPGFSWSILPAAAIHLAALALVVRHRGLPLLLVAVSVAALTRAALRFGFETPRERREDFRPLSVAASLLVAVALAAVGMIRWAGGDTRAFAFTRWLLDGSQVQEEAEERYPATMLHQPVVNAFGASGVPGVILRPKREERPIEVPRPAVRSSVGTPVVSRIPFTGEYWLYQAPLLAPPSGASVLRSGDPFALSFRTEYAALFMEARQRLPRAMDLGCCARVDLEIRNAQPAGSDSLELVLLDSLTGASQTLGRARVTAPRAVLPFPVSAEVRFHRFDMIRVKYHRGLFQLQSARIAIDAMVLVPR